MTKRSVAAVVIFSIITLFIYAIYWHVKTKQEMVDKFGADIPTAWLLIVPVGNLYWMWKYSGGVEIVTKGKMSQSTTFFIQFLLAAFGFPFVSMAILQDTFNKVPDAATLPTARVA